MFVCVMRIFVFKRGREEEGKLGERQSNGIERRKNIEKGERKEG